jgi:hypothetical protein
MDPINVEIIDRGVVTGLQTYEVIDADTGERVGWNKTEIWEELPH